jgi:hypothetical protein
MIGHMNSGNLTAAQLEKLRAHVAAERHYLDRLTGRMSQKHFPMDDPLLRKAEATRAAMTDLLAEIDKLLACNLGRKAITPDLDDRLKSFRGRKHRRQDLQQFRKLYRLDEVIIEAGFRRHLPCIDVAGACDGDQQLGAQFGILFEFEHHVEAVESGIAKSSKRTRGRCCSTRRIASAPSVQVSTEKP